MYMIYLEVCAFLLTGGGLSQQQLFETRQEEKVGGQRACREFAPRTVLNKKEAK